MNLEHAQKWAHALGHDIDALGEMYADWFTLEHTMVDDHLLDTITDRDMLKAALGGIASGENGTYTFTANEWLGGTAGWAQQVHPDDREATLTAYAAAVAASGSFEAQYRLIDAAGEVRWVWDLAETLRDESGEVPIEARRPVPPA